MCRQNPQAARPRCGEATLLFSTSSHHRASHRQHPPHLHFVWRYFITALLPKSPPCMSEAQELCSTSKHEEGVQRSSARALGIHPKPGAPATYSQQHTLQPQPKKNRREMLGRGASSTAGGGATPAGARQEQVDEGASSSHEFTAALCLARCHFYSTIFNIFGF